MAGRAPDKLKLDTFVAAYLINGNCAADAARQAGYSTKNSRKTGSNLLRRPEVVARIEAARSEIQKNSGYDAKAAMIELDKNLLLANEQKNGMAAARLIELKMKLNALLIDRSEVYGRPSLQIIIAGVDDPPPPIDAEVVDVNR